MIWQTLIGLSMMICWMLLYMAGGQWGTQYKRYVLPPVEFTLVLVLLWLRGMVWWAALPVLLYIPVYVEGYGEKSWIAKLVKKDLWVRIVYGLLASIPIVATSVCLLQPWKGFLGILIPIAYIPELGSWGKFRGKDILGSDLLRAAVTSACWIAVLV